jgi:hypothetical protein
MGKFDFRDRTLKLDIAGNAFEIDAAVGEELHEQKTILVNAIKEFQEGKKTRNETIAVYEEYFNRILGDDAFKKIFTKRVPTIIDCSDLLVFITDEITKLYRKPALKVVK